MCLNACKMAVFNHSAYMLMAQWCAEGEGEEEEERRKQGGGGGGEGGGNNSLNQVLLLL